MVESPVPQPTSRADDIGFGERKKFFNTPDYQKMESKGRPLVYRSAADLGLK